jgi:nitrogen fixation-related uncharacterized protein
MKIIIILIVRRVSLLLFFLIRQYFHWKDETNRLEGQEQDE